MSAPASRILVNRLEGHRRDLEEGQESIAVILALAYDLLHDSGLTVADPNPLATQANLAALVDCARMSADLLARQSGAVFEALDADGGAS